MRKTAIALLFTLSACAGPASTLLVGSYSDGFYAIDYPSGEVIAKADMPNPSFLALDGTRIYAVSEMPDETASVWAWRYNGNGFEKLNAQPTGIPTGGEDPCHVAVGQGRMAVSNYSGGTLALYRIEADGRIAPMDSLIVSGTGGPDLSRQATPHVHCSVFTPDGKHLLFSEFSADAIGQIDLTGGISNYRTAARLPADFSAKQVIKADETDARGAADLHLSPDGKYLYASLRLRNDGIAIFRVKPDGSLEKAGYQRTGPHPRNFLVTAGEVLVACRDNDSIEIYKRNPKTGLLTDTGRRISAPKPVFVALQ